MRTPVTTKDSAAATVQRSTSTVRIDLGKVLVDIGRRRSGCKNELHIKRTFTRLMTHPSNRSKKRGVNRSGHTPTERCLQIGLEGSPSCSAAGRCPSPRVRA
jgi:hypothetical protein